MFTHSLRMALRQLKKNKTQHVLSIIGIAVGMLCFSMTNYYIRVMYTQYTAWPNSDRMAWLYTKSANGNQSSYVSGDVLQQFLNNPPAGIEKSCLSRLTEGTNVTFSTGEGRELPFLCSTYQVTEDFFSIYAVQTKDGQTPFLRPGEAIISASMARKAFGKENPVGNTVHLTLPDSQSAQSVYYTITAVIDDLPEYTVERRDLYFLQTEPIDPNRRYLVSVTLLLHEGVNSNIINERLQQQIPPFGPDGSDHLMIQTFSDTAHNPISYLTRLIFALIGGLVLIASMINFLKLSIQSFYSRTHELALRRCLGSGQTGLFYLLFSEILILLLLAMLATFMLTELFLPLYHQYIPYMVGEEGNFIHIPILDMLAQEVEYMAILFLLSAAICYLTVYRIRHINLVRGIQGGRSRHSVRNALLGFQLFICFLFTGASVVFFYTAQKMDQARYFTLTKKDTRHIWHISLSEPQLQGHETEILSRIRALSGVEDILLQSNGAPLTFQTPADESFEVNTILSSPNYASFMQLPLEGRLPAAPNEIALTRSFGWMQERMGETSPTGLNQVVVLNNEAYTVTGLFEQTPFQPLLTKEQFYEATWRFHPTAILLSNGPTTQSIYIKCIPGQEQEVKENVTRAIRTFLPSTIPFAVSTMEKENLQVNIGSQMGADLFGLLAAISLLITAFGIYSAITIDARTRQKEVAIRKVNGAEEKDIAFLFSKLYFLLLCIGALTALPLVYLFMHFILRNEGVGVYVTWLYNPLLWLGIFALVSAVVFLTVAFRIRQISRLNPAEIIQTE